MSNQNKFIGSVKIQVLEARALRSMTIVSKQDPYVIVTIDEAKGQTQVCHDGAVTPVWHNQSFMFDIRSFSDIIKVEVLHKTTFGSDQTIGTIFIKADQAVANKEAAWFRLGYGAKLANYAGDVKLQFAYQQAVDHNPQPNKDVLQKSAATAAVNEVKEIVSPVVVQPAPMPVQPAPVAEPIPAVQPTSVVQPTPAIDIKSLNITEEKLAPANKSVNLSGSWRVYFKDNLGRERSYSLQLNHDLQTNTITGHGQAVDMTCTISGRVTNNQQNIELMEDWQGSGSDMMKGTIHQNGDKLKLTDEARIVKAKKINHALWNQHTHPQYYTPYYNVSGAWRIYFERKQEHEYKSYSLEITQHSDGKLSGGGVAGDLIYRIEGSIQGAVMDYTEYWYRRGSDQVLSTDKINATVMYDGTYFKCQTHHSDIQEARMIIAMTTDEEKLKFQKPF